MNVNLIVANDVQEAKDGGRLVQIKCKNCPDKGRIVKNHISIIADHIESQFPLNKCPSCGALTEIYLEHLNSIKNILFSKV